MSVGRPRGWPSEHDHGSVTAYRDRDRADGSFRRDLKLRAQIVEKGARKEKDVAVQVIHFEFYSVEVEGEFVPPRTDLHLAEEKVAVGAGVG